MRPGGQIDNQGDDHASRQDEERDGDDPRTQRLARQLG